MNTNKQLTKGNKMRKIAMVIGILSVLATNANAGSGYWLSTPDFGTPRGGSATTWNSIYVPYTF